MKQEYYFLAVEIIMIFSTIPFAIAEHPSPCHYYNDIDKILLCESEMFSTESYILIFLILGLVISLMTVAYYWKKRTNHEFKSKNK